MAKKNKIPGDLGKRLRETFPTQVAVQPVTIQEEFSTLYRQKVNENKEYWKLFDQFCMDTAKSMAELALDSMRNKIKSDLSELTPDKDIIKYFDIYYKIPLESSNFFSFTLYNQVPYSVLKSILRNEICDIEGNVFYQPVIHQFDFPENLKGEENLTKISKKIEENFIKMVELRGLRLSSDYRTINVLRICDDKTGDFSTAYVKKLYVTF